MGTTEFSRGYDWTMGALFALDKTFHPILDNFITWGLIVGIGITIVVVGSLVYKNMTFGDK
jgi:hypothetical protein